MSYRDISRKALERISENMGYSLEETASMLAMFDDEIASDKAGREKSYCCPVCGSGDPNLYLRCNRPDCTDGRDPR